MACKSFNYGVVKNNYDPQRRLVQSEKNYFGPLGAPCLERRLRIRVQLRPFQSDSTTVDELVTSEVARIGS